MLQKEKKNRGENVISEMAEALKNKGCEFPRPHSIGRRHNMDKTVEREYSMMDDLAEPRYFHGSLDTSEYVPDWAAIDASIEKNRAIIASLGGEFAELVRPMQKV